MLRPTPGALNSHLLEERPASLPTQLYMHGGRRPTSFSVMLFEPAGPGWWSWIRPSSYSS